MNKRNSPPNHYGQTEKTPKSKKRNLVTRLFALATETIVNVSHFSMRKTVSLNLISYIIKEVSNA